jgi:hypothetical protein
MISPIPGVINSNGMFEGIEMILFRSLLLYGIEFFAYLLKE